MSYTPEEKATLAERFETIWKWFPRKVGKGAAKKSWDRIRKRKDYIGDLALIEAISRHLEKWAAMDAQYIPHPATWLNQERWLDEIEGSAPSGGLALTPEQGYVLANGPIPAEWQPTPEEIEAAQAEARRALRLRLEGTGADYERSAKRMGLWEGEHDGQ